jgi:hypothetical protein
MRNGDTPTLLTKHHQDGKTELAKAQVVLAKADELAHHNYQPWESLDYTGIVNEYSVNDDEARLGMKKKSFGYSGRTLTRWILTWLVGVIMAAVAFCISGLAEFLVKYRKENIIDESVHPHSTYEDSLPTFFKFAGWNLFLAGGASCLVLFVSPQSVASGIPEVKAILNGLHVPKFLSFITFVAKFFGIIMTVASGLVLGPEGPLVHLGAIVGSAMTRGQKTIQLNGKKTVFRFPSFMHGFMMQFRNDVDRRDFISIGAACGFAAAFGAPIGGVLFALEEAASFWSDKLMWRALTATTLATIVLRFVKDMSEEPSSWTTLGLDSYGLISLKTPVGNGSIDAGLLLPVTVIGIYGGLIGVSQTTTPLLLFSLPNASPSSDSSPTPPTPPTPLSSPPGALFNQIMLVLSANKRLRPAATYRNWPHRLAIVVVMSILTSAIMFYAPMHAGKQHAGKPGWACHTTNHTTNVAPKEEGDDAEEVFKDLIQFNCPEGMYNDLATIFIGGRETAIKLLLIDTRDFTWQVRM